MTTLLWTKNSGYSLGSFPERGNFTLQLPITNVNGVSYSIISGELPPGVKLSGDSLIGDPFIVATVTTFSFCIRASYNNEISDRTFSMTITGANPPEFVIQADELDIGPVHQFFAIDNTYIEYKLEAIELIADLRDNLTYFITNGSLPPGLTLSSNGLISGIVNVLTTETPDNMQGIYPFTVSVTDGYLVTTKDYSIYIVGPLYLTADNDSLLDGNHIFSSDVTSLRPIQWKTSSNLGKYDSNNYITIPIELVDNADVFFTIDNTNNLPPGMSFDQDKAVLYGSVPYLTFISKTYTFSITATRYNYYTGESLNSVRTFTLKLMGDLNTEITWDNIKGTGAILTANLGYNNSNGLPQADQVLSINIINGGTGYVEVPSILIIPTNGGSDATAYCVIKDGSIYSVDVTNPGNGYITAPNIELSQSLGAVDDIHPSTLVVSATSSIKNSILSYTLVSGALPPGLSLAASGEIIGKANKLTLTTFQGTTFDGNSTTVDDVFIFTVQASHQYGSSTKVFSINRNHFTTKNYSNIIVKPLLIKSQRDKWNDFINNITIFPLDHLYRITDEYFGLNIDLSMLIFAGIETTNTESYVNAIALNTKKKRFLFNSIKTSIAKDPVSNEELYEVIYVEMNDPEELYGSYLPLSFIFNDVTYYSNSVTNWQLRISETMDSSQNVISNDQSLLPLWMRTLTHTQIPGFVLGMPICYCKVGMAASIVLNINNYINNSANNFSFNDIDYTIDRYIIDAVTNESGPQYIIFNNNRTTV